jgi:hypothetical protein
MGLLGKKVTDQEWAAAITREVVEPVMAICALFETAGQAVTGDPVVGWIAVSDALSSLDSYDALFRSAKRSYTTAGNPEGRDALITGAKQRLDTFFAVGAKAMHWGKGHYGDASGAPGERARWGTGLAQKAAIARLRSNGLPFADYALRAANAGREGVEALNAEQGQYKSAGPSLMEMFVSAISDGRSALASGRSAQLSQVAQIGAWCFQRCAILGMIVSPEPSEFISMAWNPEKIDRFWQHVEEESKRIDSAGFGEGTALGYLRLKTEYSELFGDEVFSRAMARGGSKTIQRLASTPVPVADARARWAMDAAMGLGLGIRRPALVRACLEAEPSPNLERWTQAHDAGLDIPPEPDPMSAESQIYVVTETCRAFFEEHYPNARAKLDELTA